ncbi:hypothetical protein [Sphingomonas soli]|uniref:hypothetical protein n=1 Tax=Sphingomonas soli TaxID=266127 RepID=UPI000835D4F1|nr:hypothetical protein [Sphingomonas soli]
MPGERIVSIGFLTQRDLDRLGGTFTRHFAVDDDGQFDDLLSELDKIEATPLDHDVVLRPGDAR